MVSASVLSISPGIVQLSQSEAMILMAGSMDELRKEAQRGNQQANGDDNEDGRDGGAAKLVEARCLWLIRHWLDLFQVTQVMQQILHRFIAFVRVTADGTHYDSCQRGRKSGIEL